MKHIVTILITGVGAIMAQEHDGRPAVPIENPAFSAMTPLDAADMKRLAGGMPPQVVSSFSVSFEPWSAWFGYSCPDCAPGTIHRGSPRLMMRTAFGTPFTAAAIIQTNDGQGCGVLRGPDGAIIHLTTMKDTSLVTVDKGRIRVDRYRAYDCAAGADGTMRPLPDAVRQGRYEIREIKDGVTEGMRLFEVKGTDRNGELRMTTEYRERKGQTQLLTEVYQTREDNREVLVGRGFLQRVFWQEGPGYRQIRKEEQATPGGAMKVVEHVIESWRVEPDGSRKVVEKQELVAPEQPREEKGAPSDAEHIH